MTDLLTQLEPDRTPPSPPEFNENQEILQNNSKAQPVQNLAIAQLSADELIHQTQEISLYFFRGDTASDMLQAIGRGRAETFAAIGAGSGEDVDLSAEDTYYHHLALWDRQNHRLIGAYRIGVLEDIITSQGTSGIYLDHLFEIHKDFYVKLGNSLELSRSFILPSYQKSPRMLDLLWKGLGIVAKKLNIKTMFGSVTISNTFSPLSQAILVDTLDTLHSAPAELRELIKAKYPFIAQTTTHNHATKAYASSGIGSLNKLILELEDNHRPIPPLIRYYLALGAKFLSFQVEPSFNNAIYCLLKVDLNAIPPRYKKRFLGE